MKEKNIVKRLTLIALMAALYVSLAYLQLTLGDFQLTLKSFVLIFVSLALPLPDALLVSFIGSFIEQLQFGLSLTTILWMMPVILRVLFISIINYIYLKGNSFLYNHKVACIIIIVLSALVVTFSNTLVMYVDSIIYKYPFSFVIFSTSIRLIINIALSICETMLIFKLISSLEKAEFIPIKNIRDEKKLKINKEI